MSSLCMAHGLLYCVGGQLGLFNGSHDVTFSTDYRRLDDGSPPGYSNNRWDVGLCVQYVCERQFDPPFCSNFPKTHFHLHVCA